MAENVPSIGRNVDIQVCKAHRSPNNFNLKRSSQRYIMIKLSKTRDKERGKKSSHTVESQKAVSEILRNL